MDQNQKKVMNKFSNTFKNPNFSHFLGGKAIIFKKFRFVIHSNTWAPKTMLSSRKN